MTAQLQKNGETVQEKSLRQRPLGVTILAVLTILSAIGLLLGGGRTFNE